MRAPAAQPAQPGASSWRRERKPRDTAYPPGVPTRSRSAGPDLGRAPSRVCSSDHSPGGPPPDEAPRGPSWRSPLGVPSAQPPGAETCSPRRAGLRDLRDPREAGAWQRLEPGEAADAGTARLCLARRRVPRRLDWDRMCERRCWPRCGNEYGSLFDYRKNAESFSESTTLNLSSSKCPVKI